jgi:hypothetical protein
MCGLVKWLKVERLPSEALSSNLVPQKKKKKRQERKKYIVTFATCFTYIQNKLTVPQKPNHFPTLHAIKTKQNSAKIAIKQKFQRRTPSTVFFGT